MKIQLNLNTEDKDDITTLGKIYKALSDKTTKSDIDTYIERKVKELMGVKK